MTTYNFSEISDFEFEALCRDLLQAELGVSVELFCPGPDQGIDLRYIGVIENESHTIVGQCKRWSEKSFNRLLSHLKRDELPKIQKLAPGRYILMTSVELNPSRKDKIVAVLRPSIQNPSDVHGKQDICGLLAQHSEVERRHVKLWLTSTEVLNALLHSDTFNRSEDALDQAKRQLRLWVPNPSFDRAREILDVNRVCVISGAPGIGKSMLANVLSAGYASIGYQLVAISGDIAEGESAWRSNIRQIFLYDDFLGHVTYGELQLRKNEESGLAKFLDRVRNSENKRFILTTREYILSEAQLRYEGLSNKTFLNTKYVIELEDYTQLIRAKILYNHLFFSDLPSNLKTALIPNQQYRNVIRHRNYNPRVIEHVIGLPSVASLSPDEFVSNIFASLDNPTEVWDVIFRNLPDVARRILLAVASLPTQVFLEDVRRVVESLSPLDFDADGFRDAIDMIEGTFINLIEAIPGSKSRQRIVVIRDPSVRDYLWARFEAVDGEADTLLDRAVFFEQCIILYEGQNHAFSIRSMFPSTSPIRSRIRDVVDDEAVAIRAAELIDSNTPMVKSLGHDDAKYFERESVSVERRTSFLLAVRAAHQTSQAVEKSASLAMDMTMRAWERGQASPSDALELLKQIVEVEGSLHDDLLDRAGRALLSVTTSRLHQTDDFEELVGLAALCPNLFMEPQRSLESWSSEFADFLEGQRDWLLDGIDDPDWLEEEMRSISKIASAMGMDIFELESDTESRIENLRDESEPENDDDLPEVYSELEDESVDEAEIDALFQSLR